MKRILLLLMLIIPSQVWAMKQKLIAPYTLVPNTGATRYATVFSPKAITSGEQVSILPAGVTFQGLHVALGGDPDAAGVPGSDKGYTITLRWATGADAMADTLMAVTILSSTANYRASYTATTVSAAAGDRVSVSIAPTGGPASTVTVSFILDIEGTTAGESILLGNTNASVGTVTPIYGSVAGDVPPTATENQAYTLVPCDGTITQLYGWLSAAPGVGYTRTATLDCNGAGACAGGAVINWANASGAQNAAQNIAVSAGDLISVAWTYVGGVAPTAGTGAVGIVFKPAVDGNFVIPYAAGTTQLSPTAARYLPIAGSVTAPSSSTTSNSDIGWDDFSIKASYVWLDAAPDTGAGVQSYTFTLLKDGAAVVGSEFDIVIADAAVSGNNTTDTELTLAQWSIYATKIVPAGTATAARATVSYLGYIAPTTSTKRGILLRGVGD